MYICIYIKHVNNWFNLLVLRQIISDKGDFGAQGSMPPPPCWLTVAGRALGFWLTGALSRVLSTCLLFGGERISFSFFLRSCPLLEPCSRLTSTPAPFTCLPISGMWPVTHVCKTLFECQPTGKIMVVLKCNLYRPRKKPLIINVRGRPLQGSSKVCLFKKSLQIFVLFVYLCFKLWCIHRRIAKYYAIEHKNVWLGIDFMEQLSTCKFKHFFSDITLSWTWFWKSYK